MTRLRVEYEVPLARVTLDRSDRRNAVSGAKRSAREQTSRRCRRCSPNRHDCKCSSKRFRMRRKRGGASSAPRLA